MTKKISIAILSIIFIFVFAPAVFASQQIIQNVSVDGDNDFSLTLPSEIMFLGIAIKPVSGDWSGTDCTTIGQLCGFDVSTTIFTGQVYQTLTGTWNAGAPPVDGIATFYVYGDFVSSGASSDLTTIMGVIITSSVDLTVSVFTTYWPYVLVIGIIAGLIIVFARLTGLGIGNRKY